EHYFNGVKKVKELGFDGVDLNFGCPVKKIIKQGACSALIQNHSLAKEIIDAVKEAAGDFPVSIKTRIGFNNIDTENWLGFLLSFSPSLITVHCRTVKDLSKVPNRWEEIS